MSCVDDEPVICSSLQTVQLCAQNSLAVVKPKKELDSNADTSVLGNHWLVVHDHNRQVNVYRYDPKAGLKHAHIATPL